MGVVHGLGPQRGQWTRSTELVYGPAFHVLYDYAREHFLKFEIVVIIFSGKDTTANQVSFALLEILLNERIENR